MVISGAESVRRATSALAVLRAIAVLLLMLAAPLGTALAAPFNPVQQQSTPAVQLGSYRYQVGDTLTVRASGLEASADYVVTLTSPSGAAVDETVTSDRGGNLVVRAPLDEAGDWGVELSGPRISAALAVQVIGAGGVPGPSPQEPVPAPEDEGGGQPDEQPPDEQGEEQVPDRPNVPLPGDAGIPPAQARQSIQVDIVQGDVVGRRNDVEAWRLSFPSGSGATRGLIVREEAVLVGHGNHLLQVDRLTGTVRSRDRVPAQVDDLAEDGENLMVTVRYASGDTETIAWPPDALPAFDPVPELYGWLRAEADVAEPAARLSQDPTNPWLYLATAREQPERADVLRRGALSRARTFYEFAQLAGAFISQQPRDEALAAQAMDAALLDFVDRGYRGSLLLEPELAAAYGFPQEGLRRALQAEDMQAAAFWAPWLYRASGDGGPRTRELLEGYAAALDDAGEAEAADTWRERAAAGSGSDALTTLERAATAVGSTGWYGVIALLIAVIALHVTLAAKYWRAQTLVLHQRLEAGQSNGRLPRIFGLRYATFTEKLVIILLFAAMVAVAALAGWVGTGDARPAALGSGSLATPTSRALLQDAQDNADTAFVRGYAAQTAGDLEAATALYRDLSRDADAMNNLGVLRSDPELFRLALELDATHEEAAFNLGQTANPSRLMQAYRPDQPLLAVPDDARLTRAYRGGPWGSLGAAFTNPFVALRGLDIEPAWLWTVIVVLFLAWVAWTILTVFYPRPPAARNAPRTFLYHLLALVLPGSGLADELWGVLLLVPWAIFGIDTLLHLLPLGAPPAMSFALDVTALIVIYVINTLAFIVEFASYRRRMRDLRSERPEVAAAYGLRP